MEFACLGRAIAAEADDGSHHPGFPRPLRPPQGDGHLEASRRMDELMWELHMERIRQDTILRQLAGTERAMAARFGPPGHWPLQLQAPPPSQDYWHHRRPPSLPPWDVAAPRPPRATTGHPPCSFGSPTAARPPPLYPHVERSPSPPLANDGGQQQERGPPGAEVRPILGGDMDGYRSPSKWILSDGATLVPAAANAGAGTAMMTPVEVTLGYRRTVGEEPKHGAEDGHGVQPFYGSGNQSSEQETVESTIKVQSDELVVRPCQYGLASQENATCVEQKRTTSIEGVPPQVETEELKRKLVPPQVHPLPQSFHLCQVITPSLVEHQASKRHRRLSKLKARKKTAEATTGSPLLCRNVAENSGGGGNAPRPADDGDRERVQSTRWTCQGCDAKFNSSSNLKEHLAGSLHRENTEAILAKFSSSYRLENGGGPGLSVYYCKACKVHCTGGTMLASHLVGRRHRRKKPEARE